jgi:hypothetical protein
LLQPRWEQIPLIITENNTDQPDRLESGLVVIDRGHCNKYESIILYPGLPISRIGHIAASTTA